MSLEEHKEAEQFIWAQPGSTRHLDYLPMATFWDFKERTSELVLVLLFILILSLMKLIWNLKIDSNNQLKVMINVLSKCFSIGLEYAQALLMNRNKITTSISLSKEGLYMQFYNSKKL